MTTWNVPRAGRLGAISILIIALLALSLVQPASADSAKKLRFDAAPSTTVAGQIVPTVRVNVLDQQDRVVSDSTAEVTVALSSGGTLYGDNVDGGVASFSTIRVIPAGSFTLTATSPGLLPDAASLVITGAGTVCTSNGCPTLNDPNGATPTGSNSTTGTLKISSCPGAGTNTDFASYDEATATF